MCCIFCIFDTEKKNSSNRPCKAEFGGIAKINLHVKGTKFCWSSWGLFFCLSVSCGMRSTAPPMGPVEVV